MSTYRVDRALLLEQDMTKGRPLLDSIRDADFRHQSAAMVLGYKSVAEMAVDELVGIVRELQGRLDVLEGQMRGMHARVSGWQELPE